MVVEAIARPGSRVRRAWQRVLDFLVQPPGGMRNDSLDDTSVRRRRAEDADPATFRASGSGINFPTGVLLYLVAQLIGGIWWAATMQAKVDYLTAENAKVWQKNEVLEMRLSKADSEFSEKVRAKVRETIDDLNLIRIHRRGE